MEHRSHPHSGVPGDVPDRRLIEPEARKVLPGGLENPVSTSYSVMSSPKDERA